MNEEEQQDRQLLADSALGLLGPLSKPEPISGTNPFHVDLQEEIRKLKLAVEVLQLFTLPGLSDRLSNIRKHYKEIHEKGEEFNKTMSNFDKRLSALELMVRSTQVINK